MQDEVQCLSLESRDPIAAEDWLAGFTAGYRMASLWDKPMPSVWSVVRKWLSKLLFWRRSR